jgi:hypothetical protein
VNNGVVSTPPCRHGACHASPVSPSSPVRTVFVEPNIPRAEEERREVEVGQKGRMDHRGVNGVGVQVRSSLDNLLNYVYSLISHPIHN